MSTIWQSLVRKRYFSPNNSPQQKYVIPALKNWPITVEKLTYWTNAFLQQSTHCLLLDLVLDLHLKRILLYIFLSVLSPDCFLLLATTISNSLTMSIEINSDSTNCWLWFPMEVVHVSECGEKSALFYVCYGCYVHILYTFLFIYSFLFAFAFT